MECRAKCFPSVTKLEEAHPGDSRLSVSVVAEPVDMEGQLIRDCSIHKFWAHWWPGAGLGLGGGSCNQSSTDTEG